MSSVQKAILVSMFTICLLNIGLYFSLYLKGKKDKVLKQLGFFWVSLLILFFVEVPIQHSHILMSVCFGLNLVPVILLSKTVFDSYGEPYNLKLYSLVQVVATAITLILWQQGFSFTAYTVPIVIGILLPYFHCLLLLFKHESTPIHYAMGLTHIIAIITAFNFAVNRTTSDPDVIFWGWTTALLNYILTSSVLPFFALQEVYKSEKQRLEELVRIRTDQLATLSSVLSHDVRNALQIISMNLSLSKRRNNFLLVERANEKAEEVSEMLKGLNLYFSAIKGVKHQINDQTSLENALIKIADDFSLLAEEKGIKLKIASEIDNTEMINFNEGVFNNCVLGNIINNAIKFSDEGSTITLTARRIQDKVQVSISDQGKGMNKNQVEELFINKSVTHKGTKGEGGTGLGLPIVKEVVEFYGGEVRVSSKENKGTTFTLTF